VKRPTFDLQSHSRHSDGALEPADVVRAAAAAGVELLALSDHDTVDGVPEAVAAGPAAGVRVVPAAELSAVHDHWEDLHVLGYEIDVADATLAERLAGARTDRELRAEKMAARLRDLGWDVDDTQIVARREAGSPIGRPHLASAVIDHPANAERLATEHVGDVSAFIPAYLIPGAPAYLSRTRPTVAEAIGWVHDAGGVAIWAHPFWDIESPKRVLAALDDFVALGLDGVEAFYATFTREQTLRLVDAAADRDLLTTGSADFHGPAHRMFSRFRAFQLYGQEPRLGPIGV